MTSHSNTGVELFASSISTTFTALNPKGRKLTTLGDYVSLLPPELRYMIYDALVEGRFIDVLGTREQLLSSDVLGKMCETSEFWKEDISNWLVGRKQLTSWKETGVFGLRHSNFLLSFQELVDRKGEVPEYVKDQRVAELNAWGNFAHSEIFKENVQHITIDLARRRIFANGTYVKLFQRDLRFIQNFRKLQRIDIHLHEGLASTAVNTHLPVVQTPGAGVERMLLVLEKNCRDLSKDFWRFGGWCHPARACSCCEQPELRFWYQYAGTQEWLEIMLPFDENERELRYLDAKAEANFAVYDPMRSWHRGHHRFWLKVWAAR